jgi:acetyl esterase/lipase
VTLDPEIAAVIDALNGGFPRVATMTGPDVRAAILARRQPVDNPEPVADVIDRAVPGPGGDIPIRIYRPASHSGAAPLVVFAHGGGFVFCDLDSHDALCRAMANGVGAVVVAVDYRLAPEHRWPAAAEDMYAVTRWAAENAGELGADAGRLVVAGDSAGGNLAAVTSVMARDRGGPGIAAQLLIYPVIAANFETESYRAYATGYYNNHEAMVWYWDQYVPNACDREHPYASPAQADPAGLPAAVVITAEFDPPRTEGDQFAQALASAGVPVVHRCYQGAIHGFMTMPNLGLGARARDQTWNDLRGLLAQTGGA